ncbi:MAG: J domain-containing protein [Planctomycetes bacterium]|nr:J domain-containing protein [Planctomycetota bacterium]
MDNRRNYYRILKVQPDAPFEIIRTSYLTLLHKLKQHPDLGGDLWNAQVLIEAYRVLSDKEKRAEYDRKLYNHYTKILGPKERGKKPVTTVLCPYCKRPLSGLSGKPCNCARASSQPKKRDNSKEGHRRSITRIEKHENFHFTTSDSEDVHDAQMVDLSPKGVRFHSRKELKPYEIITIDSSFFHAIAEVVSSEKIVKGFRTFYSVGSHFQSISFTHQDGTFLSTSA